jgi:hypothetical protein
MSRFPTFASDCIKILVSVAISLLHAINFYDDKAQSAIARQSHNNKKWRQSHRVFEAYHLSIVNAGIPLVASNWISAACRAMTIAKWSSPGTFALCNHVLFSVSGGACSSDE